ncbi:hypothetical protein [Sphingomicrobium aestuariivivum]|uniref:hypothetical protein n=1 Tax=Sphingomicrobium aestuariivivum TaxID=1582356 RepID=UPI001FD67D05|nr:hypothetical protein [Sphingomicrobium aestuariivivum]MCJ8189895.1 hypothetical protein [Sphingomicrobium aestuariivivum]
MISLHDCEEQLGRAKTEPLRLAQAAKSAHLALQSALIDALAGSASIGAYDEKLRSQYLSYFENTRAGLADLPKSDRVMSFNRLLAKATEQPMEWSGRSLEVSDDERDALERLSFLRDRIEHPRPDTWLIEPQFISLTLPVAARLTLRLLDERSHHYEEGHRQILDNTVATITNYCAAMG